MSRRDTSRRDTIDDRAGRWSVADVALAVGFAMVVFPVTFAIEVAEGERGLDALAVVVMLVASLALAARQRAPGAVLARQ